ncbi:unnamed protein product, partial [Iphiclides podalirius]
MVDADEGSLNLYQSNTKPKVYFLGLNPDIPHEVIRNGAVAGTAVKGADGKRNKLKGTVYVNTDVTIRNGYEEMEALKKRLAETIANANVKTESSKAIALEINKQLERAHQRELKEQTRNLALQLENLKLRALLDTKANLVNKLMRELSSVRRVVKHVARGLGESAQSPHLANNTDLEYGTFKKELEESFLAAALGNDGVIFDSTNSEY